MRRFLYSVLATILAAACTPATSYNVNISSLADQSTNTNRTYTIIPLDESIPNTDLQFRKYSNYLKKSIPPSAGAYVDSSMNPDIVVLLGYGIGDPSDQVSSYSIPQFGQSGISSAQTYGTVTSFGNTGTYSGTTNYTPTYGITGYTTHLSSSRTYQRHISLFAYDITVDSAEPKQVWQTVITSRGTNNDLRRVFPAMLAAANPLIASNTGGSVSVDIKENDERIVSLKATAQ